MNAVRRGIKAAAIVAGALLATGAQGYDELPVSGGGTIRGKVSYSGSVPAKKIIPTKDRAVCGGPRDEPQIRVGADHGVQDAVVYFHEHACVRRGSLISKALNPALPLVARSLPYSLGQVSINRS